MSDQTCDPLGDGIPEPEGELSDVEPQTYKPIHRNKTSSVKPRMATLQQESRVSSTIQNDKNAATPTETDRTGNGSKWMILCLAFLVCLLLCVTVNLCMEQNHLKIQLDNLKLELGSSTIDIQKFFMQPNLEHSEIKNLKHNIDKSKTDFDELDRRLITVDSRVNKLDSKVTSWEGFINSASDEVRKVPAIENNVQNLYSDMENVKTFKHDIEQLEKMTTAGQLITSDIKQRTVILETGQQSLDTDINKKMKPQIEKLIEQAGNLETELQTLKTEDVMTLKQKKEEMENMLSSLQESYEKTRGKVDDVLLPNAFNKGFIMNALMMIMAAGLILWVYIRYTANKPAYQDRNRDDAPRSGGRNQPKEAIIYRRVDLKSSICVVRFSDNLQSLHTKLLAAIFDGLPKNVAERCPRVFHNITSHEDIENLPPVKLIILFVDYSERHIIIEEAGLGLGDFKRTTLQAINRIKGDAMIIYLKDPSSKSLPKNARYNPDIHCVKTQEALSTLNKNGRFFSVFDSLTEFQKSCIQATISDIINDRST